MLQQCGNYGKGPLIANQCIAAGDFQIEMRQERNDHNRHIPLNQREDMRIGIATDHQHRIVAADERIDVQQHRSKSVISANRGAITPQMMSITNADIDPAWLYSDVDILGMVDTTSTPIFVQYIKDIIDKEGVEKFKSINVWSDELCQQLGVKDPRTLGWKWLHKYLSKTHKYRRSSLVRGIDKLLKYFV